MSGWIMAAGICIVAAGWIVAGLVIAARIRARRSMAQAFGRRDGAGAGTHRKV